MQVLGLSGKAGQGKDAVYEYILRPRGWKRWSFAHPIKAAGVGNGFSVIEVTETKPPHVRKWLQEYGTEEHRNKYRPDFWIRAASYWMHTLERDLGVRHVVFTDVRFPNEANWIRSQGGKLVRLQGRPYPLAGTPAAEHPSETALDDWLDWDAVIDNGPETSLVNIGIELQALGVIE